MLPPPPIGYGCMRDSLHKQPAPATQKAAANAAAFHNQNNSRPIQL